MIKYCYFYTQPEGKEPELCFEGTNCEDECVLLSHGGVWMDCKWGGEHE